MVKHIIAACYYFYTITVLCSKIKTTLLLILMEEYITLSEVVVNNKINVPAFIDRVRNDTTFYKAFRTLRITWLYCI
ncbi:MAG: hypothetical protein WKF59_01860 [Chitinophagaceae bacterium]